MNKGYTLMEMLLVLLILSIMLLIGETKIEYVFKENTELIISDIAYQQVKAVMENETQEYDEEDIYLRFNRIGNVNQANSFYINDDWIIVSLGTGRIYEDDE